MGHVYRNLKPVPIPPDGYCNRYNGTVFRMYRDSGGHRSRTVIGCMAETGMMFPNDNFRELYPDLWARHYGDNIPEQRFARTGLYALSLGAGYRTLLYPVLAESLGARDANVIMDFAMYSIQEDDDKSSMPEVMGKYMLFSARRMNEAWYRKFFSEELSPALVRLFCIRWLKQLQKEHGLESVWLCTGTADLGSAANCGSLSGSISYVWAADSRDGRPVSYFVCKGALPSRKDLEEITSFVSSCNVAVKGVILESDHASPQILKEIRDSGLEYVVRLKPDTYGYADMHARHAKDICWEFGRLLEPAVFGIAGQGRLFSAAEDASCTGLFFSGDPVLQRDAIDLVTKIRTTAVQLQQRLARNPDNVSVPDEFKKYISLERDENGVLHAVCNRERCQKILDNTGYFALASSEELSAGELYGRYKLCLASEKQFAAFRDMLLNDAIGLFSAGLYSDRAAGNFFLAGLAAAVIRTEMKLACHALEREDIRQRRQERLDRSSDGDEYFGDDEDSWDDEDQGYDWEEDILHDLDCILMIRTDSGHYQYVDRPEPHAERLLACFGITTSHLERLAGQKIVQDLDTCYEGIRAIPSLEPAKSGRSKGLKNKKTLEKERRLREAVARGEITPADAVFSEAEPEAKRGPGRPKGSRNKKTLEKERQLREAAARGEITPADAVLSEAEPSAKRGPGRPKGSRNKKTLEKERQLREAAAREEITPAESELSEATPSAKRGPGRPKGSRNKKTLELEKAHRLVEAIMGEPEPAEAAPAEATPSAKRGPGRPKGSKNRKTPDREQKEAAGAAPLLPGV